MYVYVYIQPVCVCVCMCVYMYVYENLWQKSIIHYNCNTVVWFGIRKNFYEWAVKNIPILQEYCNISYNYPDEVLVLEEGTKNNNKDRHRSKKLKAPVGHIEQLDVPD